MSDQRWTVARVTAAAPDASSLAAAGSLAASSAVWSDTGDDGPLVWGSCQGSGKTPYRVLVDVAGPRYKCSCPSRKFPCKHALALLLLWADHRLPSDTGGGTAVPADMAAWGAAPARQEPKPEQPQTAAQAQAAARRRAEREERIADGLNDLDRWLRDQVTTGLARAWGDSYTHFSAAAARLVDAQAPGLANRVRDLVGVAVSGEGWPARMLEEFALLHLACRAWSGREQLPEELAQTLRIVVGNPVPADEVLARPGERGRWLVAGLHDLDLGKLTSRRVWLWGLDAHSWATVMTFTTSSQVPDTSLAPGTVVDAQLHRYPGSGNQRALLAERFGEVAAASLPDWRPPVRTLAELVADHRALLAANPWAEASPASTQVRVLHTARGFRVEDVAGDQAPLHGWENDLWRLTGLLAGQFGHVLGEWTPDGLRPASVVTATGLELL